MPRSKSGRLLIEIEPKLKEELYETLEKEGINLKTWFLENVESYLSAKSQLKLTLVQTHNQSTHK